MITIRMAVRCCGEVPTREECGEKSSRTGREMGREGQVPTQRWAVLPVIARLWQR